MKSSAATGARGYVPAGSGRDAKHPAAFSFGKRALSREGQGTYPFFASIIGDEIFHIPSYDSKLSMEAEVFINEFDFNERLKELSKFKNRKIYRYCKIDPYFVLIHVNVIRIPPEILGKIGEFLYPPEQLEYKRTSKDISRVVNVSFKKWMKELKEEFGQLSAKISVKFSKKGKSFMKDHVFIEGPEVDADLFIDYPRLNDLDVRFLRTVEKHGIQRLKIYGNPLRFSKMSIFPRTLKSLTHRTPIILDDNFQLVELDCISTFNSFVYYITSNGSELKYLSMELTDKEREEINDEKWISFFTGISNLPKLEILELKNCKLPSNKSIWNILIGKKIKLWITIWGGTMSSRDFLPPPTVNIEMSLEIESLSFFISTECPSVKSLKIGTMLNTENAKNLIGILGKVPNLVEFELNIRGFGGKFSFKKIIQTIPTGVKRFKIWQIPALRRNDHYDIARMWNKNISLDEIVFSNKGKIPIEEWRRYVKEKKSPSELWI
jgi:hypothetical protein